LEVYVPREIRPLNAAHVDGEVGVGVVDDRAEPPRELGGGPLVELPLEVRQPEQHAHPRGDATEIEAHTPHHGAAQAARTEDAEVGLDA